MSPIFSPTAIASVKPPASWTHMRSPIRLRAELRGASRQGMPSRALAREASRRSSIPRYLSEGSHRDSAEAGHPRPT